MVSKKQRKPAKPRDPFWRLRRIFGERKRPGKTNYRRTEQRKMEREAGDERE